MFFINGRFNFEIRHYINYAMPILRATLKLRSDTIIHTRGTRPDHLLATGVPRYRTVFKYRHQRNTGCKALFAFYTDTWKC
jgi:hypothetical protein